MGKNEFHMMMGRRLRFIQQILHIHVVVEARLYLFLEGEVVVQKSQNSWILDDWILKFLDETYFLVYKIP